MYLEWYLKEQAAGEKTLEETVVELLAEKGFHITTAESCTGGMIAGTLVNVAGASEVLNEGYVTYSNEAKERLVRVSHQTLEQFGAVSEQTAREGRESRSCTEFHRDCRSGRRNSGKTGGTGLYRLLSEWKDYSERMPVYGKPDGKPAAYSRNGT